MNDPIRKSHQKPRENIVDGGVLEVAILKKLPYFCAAQKMIGGYVLPC